MKCDACKAEFDRFDLNWIEMRVEGSLKWKVEICDACKVMLEKKLDDVKNFVHERK